MEYADNLRKLGFICANFRKDICKYQRDVAFDCNVSVETVCAFEHGRTNNAMVFLWYVDHGLPVECLKGVL